VRPSAPWILSRANFVLDLKKSGRVLELGCGGGETALALAHAGYRVRGVDESANAIRLLAEHHQAPGIEWVCASLLDSLALEKETFDVVTMFHVLEHVPQPRQAVSLVHAALKEAGIFVVEVPDVGGGISRIWGKRWRYYEPHHVNYFSRRSLKRLLESAGFKLLKVKPTFHVSQPQGHPLKDPIKEVLARLGLNSIIRTAWLKV
jgi:2-polyprenyl-3-methyl-5-hydroxy-6-metoxy-1,4-benzoquinol methylase